MPKDNEAKGQFGLAWRAAFSECLSGTDSERLRSEPAASGARARDRFAVDFFVHG
jgi:hypothetical protein